ncbi:chitobiase/beta-hexosaminidase C-terminal domain-containing protein [Ruminococcaceae bacterium OttesenSCG-928-L11]|nr:chitobiase/beta-hexosaminidase C-terminal domain-containing protein [Ruminococcaceae bacterium OttesenSCG-928-L11]
MKANRRITALVMAIFVVLPLLAVCFDNMEVQAATNDIGGMALLTDEVPLTPKTSSDNIIKDNSNGQMVSWNDVKNNPAGDYTLTEDLNIDAVVSVILWPTAAFTGRFDGGNHTIYLRTGTVSTKGNSLASGLFGMIDGGTVENLRVKYYSGSSGEDWIHAAKGTYGTQTVYTYPDPANADTRKVENAVGILAGRLKDGTIRNVEVYGNLTVLLYTTNTGLNNGKGSTDLAVGVGGVVGAIESGSQNSTVDNCFYQGNVSVYNPQSLYYCHSFFGAADNANSSPSTSSSQRGSIGAAAGGIAGIVLEPEASTQYTSITNCMAKGAVNNAFSTYIDYLLNEVRYPYSWSNISLVNYAGGIAGYYLNKNGIWWKTVDNGDGIEMHNNVATQSAIQAKIDLQHVTYRLVGGAIGVTDNIASYLDIRYYTYVASASTINGVKRPSNIDTLEDLGSKYTDNISTSTDLALQTITNFNRSTREDPYPYRTDVSGRYSAKGAYTMQSPSTTNAYPLATTLKGKNDASINSGAEMTPILNGAAQDSNWYNYWTLDGEEGYRQSWRRWDTLNAPYVEGIPPASDPESIVRTISFFNKDTAEGGGGSQTQALEYVDQIRFAVEYTTVNVPQAPNRAFMSKTSVPSLGASELALTLRPAPSTGVTYYYTVVKPDGNGNTDVGNAPDLTTWNKYSGENHVAHFETDGDVLFAVAVNENEYAFAGSRNRVTSFSNISDILQKGDAGQEALLEPHAQTEMGIEYPVDGKSYVYTGPFVLHEFLEEIGENRDINLNKVITIRAWNLKNGEVNQTQSYSFKLGGRMQKPYFSPTQSGMFDGDTSITIHYPDNNASNYELLYAISTTGNMSTPTWTENPDPSTGSLYLLGSNTKRATSGVPIQEEFGADIAQMTIRAVAVPKHEYAPPHAEDKNTSASDFADVTYTANNRPVPSNLRLYYKEAGSEQKRAFLPNKSYEKDTTFFLEHAEFVDGEPVLGVVRYGVASSTELDSLYDSKIGIGYDDLSRLDSLTLYARYDKTNYPSSTVSSFGINFKVAHGEAEYKLVYQRDVNDATTAQTISPDALHRTGNYFSFQLNTRDIPTPLRPNANEEVTGVESIEEYLSGLPTIRYSIAKGDTAPDKLTNTAYPPIPKLVNSSGATIEGTPSTGTIIGIPGAQAMQPGEQITLNYQLIANSTTSYSDGPVQTLTLTIRERLDAPLAIPDPSDPIARDQKIELHTDQPGNNIKIYYMVGGATPQVEWKDGRYVPVGDTLEYTTPIALDSSSPSIMTIRAMTVALDDTVDYSAVETYRYNVSNLSKAPAATAYPATSNENPTGMQRGETIILRPSVPGYDVYYTTDGSLPDPDQYDGANPTATATRLYKDGIPMDPGDGQMEFVVTAIVRDPTQTKHADSDEVQFYYSILQAQTPVAFPHTEENNVTILAPGSSITLSCGTPNTTIYYTTDNSYPTPGSANTYRYDPNVGITMPSDGKAFFTVNAIARQETGSVTVDDSERARFIYSPPTPVQAVYAMPSEGEVVLGTEVTLISGTDGAMIFYEIAYDNDDPKDPVPYQSQPYSEKQPIVINKDTTIRAVAIKDNMQSDYTEYVYEVSKKVSTPRPSIPGGSVVERGTKLTLRSSTSSSTIIYTKDGSDPTKSDNKNRMYGSEIVLDAEEGKSVSISAYAIKDGLSPSDVVSFSYSISKSGDVFTASPPSGSVVDEGSQIILSSSLTDAAIYYTTDGSDPTVDSSSGGSITVRGEPGSTFLIKAVALMGTSTTTTPKMFSYTITARTAPPSSSIPSGAITLKGAKAVLTASEGNIFYTTDGSTPTTSSQMYTEPVAIEKSMVLKAIASASGKKPSTIAEYVYTMAGQVAAPTASQQSGQLEMGTKIALATETEGATIYYSTNGVDPSESNLKDLFVYDSPITVSRPVTLKWFATKSGLHASVLNSATYTVRIPEPEQEEPDETEESYQQTLDRLMTRHDYVNQEAGPLYEKDGVVVRDPENYAVISAPKEALPENVQLKVEHISPTATDKEAVEKELDFEILHLYDVTVMKDGVAVQPSEPVEIGIPIPQQYQNAVIIICYIDDKGDAIAYPTRRSGGVAYAEVSHFSKYAITAAAVDDDDRGLWIPVPVLVAGGGALAISALIALWSRSKRGGRR